MKEIKENAIYYVNDVIDLLTIEKEDGTVVRPERTVKGIFASKDFPKCSTTKSHFITGRALLDYLSNRRF